MLKFSYFLNFIFIICILSSLSGCISYNVNHYSINNKNLESNNSYYESFDTTFARLGDKNTSIFIKNDYEIEFYFSDFKVTPIAVIIIVPFPAIGWPYKTNSDIRWFMINNKTTIKPITLQSIKDINNENIEIHINNTNKYKFTECYNIKTNNVMNQDNLNLNIPGDSSVWVGLPNNIDYFTMTFNELESEAFIVKKGFSHDIHWIVR